MALGAAYAKPLQITHWPPLSKLPSQYTLVPLASATGPNSFVLIHPYQTPFYNIPTQPYSGNFPSNVLPISTVKSGSSYARKDVLSDNGDSTIPNIGSPALVSPTSSQFRTQDENGGYHFSYSGELSSRAETRNQDGTIQGQYNYIDPAGNSREYHYVADENGFRVKDLSVLSDSNQTERKSEGSSGADPTTLKPQYRNLEDESSFSSTTEPVLTTSEYSSTTTIEPNAITTKNEVSNYLMYG